MQSGTDDVSWWREAISDEDGHGDIAYVGLATIIVMFVAVSTFECTMVLIAYVRGVPFDPMPLAQAFSLTVGAVFSTGLAGITAYMLATRKPHDDLPVVAEIRAQGPHHEDGEH